MGTLAYMPPEVLDDDDDDSSDDGAAAAAEEATRPTRTDWFKVDVFAFGVVGYEVFARKVPFKGLSSLKIVKRVVQKEERPGEIPASAPKSVKEVIELSWKQKPRDRPHMEHINRALLAELGRIESNSGSRGGSGGHLPSSIASPSSPAPARRASGAGRFSVSWLVGTPLI